MCRIASIVMLEDARDEQSSNVLCSTGRTRAHECRRFETSFFSCCIVITRRRRCSLTSPSGQVETAKCAVSNAVARCCGIRRARLTQRPLDRQQVLVDDHDHNRHTHINNVAVFGSSTRGVVRSARTLTTVDSLLLQQTATTQAASWKAGGCGEV